jgi:hypothetical protein
VARHRGREANTANAFIVAHKTIATADPRAHAQIRRIFLGSHAHGSTRNEHSIQHRSRAMLHLPGLDHSPPGASRNMKDAIIIGRTGTSRPGFVHPTRDGRVNDITDDLGAGIGDIPK